MALQKTVTTQHGLTLDSSYIKIMHIQGSKEDGLRLDVAMYADRQARINGLEPVSWGTYFHPIPSGSGNDLYTDLYTHLKTLPEFSGATDV